MTQVSIDEMNVILATIKCMNDAHEETIKTLENRYKTVKMQCDHYHPDRKSAIYSGMFCNSCDICGRRDL